MDDIGDIKLMRRNLMWIGLTIIILDIFSSKINEINLGIIKFSGVEIFTPLPLLLLLIINTYLLIRYQQAGIYELKKPRENILSMLSLRGLQKHNIVYIKQISPDNEKNSITHKYDVNNHIDSGEIEHVSIGNDTIDIITANYSFDMDGLVSNTDIKSYYNFDGNKISRISFYKTHHNQLEIHFQENRIKSKLNYLSYVIQERYFADYYLPIVIGIFSYGIILFKLSLLFYERFS